MGGADFTLRRWCGNCMVLGIPCRPSASPRSSSDAMCWPGGGLFRWWRNSTTATGPRFVTTNAGCATSWCRRAAAPVRGGDERGPAHTRTARTGRPSGEEEERQQGVSVLRCDGDRRSVRSAASGPADPALCGPQRRADRAGAFPGGGDDLLQRCSGVHGWCLAQQLPARVVSNCGTENAKPTHRGSDACNRVRQVSPTCARSARAGTCNGHAPRASATFSRVNGGPAARLTAQRRVSYMDGASSLGVGSVGISPAWVAGASAVVSGLSFSTALCSMRNLVLSRSGASSTLLGASEVILRRYEQ